MASQAEMQDLLRLLTTGRNKVPILAAMQRVKALQSASITPSISTIALTPLPSIITALSIDEKAAKSLLTACKNASKNPSKRTASTSDSSIGNVSKRAKSAYSLPDEPKTEEELEKSLQLPEPSQDEERIEKTTIFTNRAPLVLVWALQLLKYTMPGQGLSGRLSLAQAVTSANSRTKAEGLGMREKGRVDEGNGWPKVRILGREVGVLKRGGYAGWDVMMGAEDVGIKEEDSNIAVKKETKDEWAVSTPFTSKSSTFIARSISITSTTQARSSIQTLLIKNPDLTSASHNITAFRVQGEHGILEECNDDGETGGGRHLLGILQANNLIGVLLVVSRWYGGIMLGPDRWRIMTQVSNDALSQRLRVTGLIGSQEQLWGLDLDALNSSSTTRNSEMPIHKPEGARKYIMNAFASPPEVENDENKSKKKKTAKVVEAEKEENLGLLLGALDLLFGSWVGHIGREELDKRAWGWYVQCRPEVESGVAGWGGKGVVKLGDILALRRKA